MAGDLSVVLSQTESARGGRTRAAQLGGGVRAPLRTPLSPPERELHGGEEGEP